MVVPNLAAIFILRNEVLIEKRLEDNKKRQKKLKTGEFVQYKQKRDKKFVHSSEKRESVK
jgi:hypothetical protein